MNRYAELDLPAKAEALPGLLSCGQPSPEQLAAAAKAGIRTVINLCPPGEVAWDEERVVIGLGMAYRNIPVRGPVDITTANAQALHDVLADPAIYPAILHCGTANRAGALLAARHFRCEGRSLEEAIAFGRGAGLKTLEGALRECLCRGE